jgi:hypothetical protein
LVTHGHRNQKYVILLSLSSHGLESGMEKRTSPSN